MDEPAAEGLPAFFAEAPRIRVRDPLAGFLGAARDGVLEYGYADAVRLAGHSCPTVASAWLMTRAALRALWPDALPERGAVRVEMREPAQEGVTGVIANVIALVTGATLDTGFHGLAGRFDRRRLLAYGVDIAGQVRFTRTDSGASVTVAVRLDKVLADARVMQLLPKCVSGSASAAERTLFGELWQERVRKLLLAHADDPQVIVVQ